MTADTETQSDELHELAAQAAEQTVATPAPRIKTVTYTFEGISYQVRKDALEDLDVMYWVAKLQSGEEENGWMFPLVLERVLGEDQFAKFRRSQRDESGRAPLDADTLTAFMEGLFEAVGAEK